MSHTPQVQIASESSAEDYYKFEEYKLGKQYLNIINPDRKLGKTDPKIKKSYNYFANESKIIVSRQRAERDIEGIELVNPYSNLSVAELQEKFYETKELLDMWTTDVSKDGTLKIE